MDENRIELDFELKQGDYVALSYITNCAFTQLKWYVSIVVMLLFDIVAAIMTLFKSARGNLGFGVSFLFLVIFLTGTAYMLFYPRLYRRIAWKSVRSRYLSGSLADSDRHYVLDGDGICLESGGRPYRLGWDQVSIVREDPTVFLLSFSDFDSLCLIAKRAAPDSFRDWLKERLPGRRFVLYP